ncbi:MAG: FkbM family methyltransferase [Leptospirales bacterium]
MTRTETVPVRTVDDVLKEVDTTNRYHSIFLKMDTQGFEHAVLNGASRSLPRISAIQSKISCLPLYQDFDGLYPIPGNF